MKHLEKLKEALCEELDKFGKSGDITVNSLEKIHKLTDTIKNIDKIMMIEEDGAGYSETRGRMGGGHMHGSSYDDDMMYSERRGRNAKRDSMGRYSRDDAKDDMMNRLGEMMEDADPKQREALKECMRAIERA